MTNKVNNQNSAKNSNAVKTEAHDRGKKYEVAEEHRQSMIAELPKDKGWNEGLNPSRVTKKYSKSGFVQIMSISVETDLRECKSWFQVAYVGGLCAWAGVQADALQKEIDGLREKRFYSVSEAQQAADAFAARWNDIDTKSKTAIPIRKEENRRDVLYKVNICLTELEATICNSKILPLHSISDEYDEKADKILCFVFEKLNEIKSFRGSL